MCRELRTQILFICVYYLDCGVYVCIRTSYLLQTWSSNILYFSFVSVVSGVAA